MRFVVGVAFWAALLFWPGVAMARDIQQLIAQIARESGADPIAMLATSYVESGWNPKAVGDGGTSYGLYQHHVGGAGGTTHQSARRFLNPVESARERARQFARLGIHGGRGAAALQRPADAAGYARKVDETIAAIKAGKLPGKGLVNSSPGLNAGSAATGTTGASTGMSVGAPNPAVLSLVGDAFSDDPITAGLLSMAAHKNSAPAPMMPGVAAGNAAKPAPIKAGPVGKDWRWLKRMGEKKFGLRNDPGDSQATGGRHSVGSEHYDGRAIDFGTARNTQAQLQAWLRWARAQGLDAIDEGDHIHVSLPGSGT